ncbi:hypothetical protein F4680DRAFT_214502 [Xylaria scruposa]|nr:hypothetical protein F4680DRAFT_214502 [Xylaria scruposa]
MAQLPQNTVQNHGQPRFVIGIDYGTTFTGVAWTLTTGKKPSLDDINVVTNWPPGEQQYKVPSELTYTGNQGEQWGYGIGEDAYVISWTKMNLETPSKLQAIETLQQSLESAKQLVFDSRRASQNRVPHHLTRTPIDILTDYLTKVAAVVCRDIKDKRDEEVLKKFPIDLVITHPAIWDARARNATFRAARKAFMKELMTESPPGQIRLATEPEACAQYIMNSKDVDNLRKDDCFIVVDAGGGTVDLVSYKVSVVSPNFVPIRVTDVSSGRHGATNIDRYFLKRFLREKLGDNEYEKLLAIGAQRERYRSCEHTILRRGERFMFDKFKDIKEGFKGKAKPGNPPNNHSIELPDGIGEDDDPLHGIRDGKIVITEDDLEDMFKEPVEGTLELIDQQIELVRLQNLDAKCIFLSGGFSRSPYLFRRVCDLARRYKLQVVQGEDSWTAVAKGAVLMGLGLRCEKPPHVASAPYHIGVILAERFASYCHQEDQCYVDSFDGISRAKDQIKWVVAKGDLVTPYEQIEKKVKIVHKITPRGKKTGRVKVILSSHDGTSDNLNRPDQLSQIFDVTRKTVQLDYKLGSIPDADRGNYYERIRDPQTRNTYDKVKMQLEVTVSMAGDITLDLRAGVVEDYHRRTAREGYRLAYWTTLHQ